MNERRVNRVIEGVAAGALVAAAALVAFGAIPTAAEWVATSFFALFGLIAASLSYRTSSSTGATIAFLPFLSAAVVTPTFAAVIAVFVCTLASELMAGRAAQKAFFNVSQQALAQSVSILVYLWSGGQSFLSDSPRFLPLVLLVVTFMSVNKLAVSTIVSVAARQPVIRHWIRSLRASIVYDLVAVVVVYFFAFVYTEFGFKWSAMLALPMLGMRQLYMNSFALQKLNEELLQLTVAAIEARDPYTSGHSQRVARYARIIAKQVGIGGRAAERIVTAALLHDVGKIHEEFAPILRKPGRLTDKEFEIMKTHAAKSSALIAKVSHFADLVPMVHSHHEAWNGLGYPQGLVGEAIPLGARIIALADTIDAMSTSRPYRRSLTSYEVKDELTREAGRQFDPVMCRALLAPESWKTIEREIVIAVGEHPVTPNLSALIEELSSSSRMTSPSSAYGTPAALGSPD